MINIKLANKLELTPRMKLLANDYKTKPEFIPMYKKLYSSDFNQHLLTKSGKLDVAILVTFIDVLFRNQGSKYLALNDVTKSITNRSICSKSKFSKVLSQFLQCGMFLESRVNAVDLDRKFTVISFPNTIEDLEAGIDTYINNRSSFISKRADKTGGEIKQRSALIKENISNFASASIKTIEKNVIVMKNENGTSLLTILSSICPVEKTTVQSGNLTFNIPSINKVTNEKNETCTVGYRSTTWGLSESVMMFQDLKTYYALITLIYHAHVARFNEYYHKKTTPINFTHIHIDDILNLTTSGNQVSFGGTQRTKCRDSLQRIRKTVIELRPDAEIDISKIVSSSSAEHLSGSTLERTVTPLKEICRAGFYDSKGEFDESTMDYVIQLPDDLFERMFTSNFHWLFPPSFLTVDELLFALYIYLRNNWSKDKNKNIFLIEDFYYQHESSTHNLSDFISKLNALFMKMTKFKGKFKIKKALLSVSKVRYRNEFIVKIFGYNCNINLDDKTMAVMLNEELFYEALEMSSVKRKTPTWSNKLSKLTYSELLKKKRLSEDEQSNAKLMSDDSRDMLNKSNISLQKKLPKMIPCVLKELGYIKLMVGTNKAQTYYITLLSSNEYIDSICVELSTKIGASIDEIKSYIYKLVTGIPRIYQSRTIDKSDFESVYEQYLRSINTTKSTIEHERDFFSIAENNPSAFHFMMSFIRDK